MPTSLRRTPSDFSRESRPPELSFYLSTNLRPRTLGVWDLVIHLGMNSKPLLIAVLLLIPLGSVLADHISSDGSGGYWTPCGHVSSDGSGGYWTKEGHVSSDGSGGYWTPGGGHVSSDGSGGYWTREGHVSSDGSGGYWTPRGHVSSDGSGGYWGSGNKEGCSGGLPFLGK